MHLGRLGSYSIFEGFEATIPKTLTSDECLLLFQVRCITLSANKHMHTYSIWDHVNIFREENNH